jgi:hypothetical protein
MMPAREAIERQHPREHSDGGEEHGEFKHHGDIRRQAEKRFSTDDKKIIEGVGNHWRPSATASPVTPPPSASQGRIVGRIPIASSRP